jgi:hypothetical protein
MVNRKRWRMFLACGVHQRRLMGLVVTALAALLVSSCGGGGGSQKIPLQIQPLPEVASKHLRLISTRHWRSLSKRAASRG